MNPFRLSLLAALLVGFLSQSGCVTALTPKATDLEHVHELYANEFMALAAPAPAVDSLPKPPPAGDAFVQSLRAIYEYGIKYPDDRQELAHLQVLEAMIYLQSGRFGLAAAMKDKVAGAKDTLSSSKGVMVRDKMFAQNFSLLLDGWSEAKKENNREWRTFERVADGLAKAVNDLSPAERATVEADQGALYVATSSAIFYVWAAKTLSEGEDRSLAPTKKVEWYHKGRDLIGQFLTEVEKKADVSTDFGSAEKGRLRYVQWYHWLDHAATTQGG